MLYIAGYFAWCHQCFSFCQQKEAQIRFHSESLTGRAVIRIQAFHFCVIMRLCLPTFCVVKPFSGCTLEPHFRKAGGIYAEVCTSASQSIHRYSDELRYNLFRLEQNVKCKMQSSIPALRELHSMERQRSESVASSKV